MSICPFMKNSLAEASPAKNLYAANRTVRTHRTKKSQLHIAILQKL